MYNGVTACLDQVVVTMHMQYCGYFHFVPQSDN